MKARTKLTKAGKSRGRPVKLHPRHDPDSLEFDGYDAEMARDFRRQMDALDKPWLSKFGYQSETHKIVDEVKLVSDAERLCAEGNREPTVQNVAIALIDPENDKPDAEISPFQPAVERWLRSDRKHYLRSALTDRE